MIVLILLSILVFIGFVKYNLRMHHLESHVKHLPFKTPVYPIIGNSLQLIGKNPEQLFNELVDFLKEQDSPIKAYFGPILVVTIDRPEDFKTVLMSQNCLDKPYFYGFYPSKVGLMSATCKCDFYHDFILFLGRKG